MWRGLLAALHRHVLPSNTSSPAELSLNPGHLQLNPGRLKMRTSVHSLIACNGRRQLALAKTISSSLALLSH